MVYSAELRRRALNILGIFSWKPRRIASGSAGRLLFLLGVSGIGTLGLIVVAALWAGAESDLAALDRQRHLVNARLGEQIDQVAKEIDQIAVGYASMSALTFAMTDGPATSTPASPDPGIRGDISAAETASRIATSVFGYDHAFVVDAAEALVAHGDPELERRYKWIRPLLKPLLLQVRAAATADSERLMAVSSNNPFPARNGLAQLMRLQGRPTIVGIVAMHGGKGSLVRGSAGAPGLSYLIVIRFLDGEVLDELSRQQGLNGARFGRSSDPENDEVTFQIDATATGEPIGFIIWSPDLPGSRVVGRLVPALSAAGLLIAILFSVLLVRLRKSLLDLRTSEHHARHCALHDVLTGLPNRAYFSTCVAGFIADSATTSPRAALVLIDLDRFKIVNDTYGHAAGDELLRQAAARMRTALPLSTILARLGGDEFALLIKDIGTTDALVTSLMEAVLISLNESFTLLSGDACVQIGASMGIAILSGVNSDADNLMRLADVALYEAKAAGRGRWVTFEPSMDSGRIERELLKSQLRAVLDRSTGALAPPAGKDGTPEPLDTCGMLELHFQPIHRASGHAISGAEALVRWRHGTQGLLPPNLFIPLAEETGLIDALGFWVLREACRAAACWPSGLFIAVNVSPLQLRKPGFSDKVLAILDETGLPPARLELELTESALLNDDQITETTLSRLRSEGIQISLDDFGTGFSSLSHLLRFGIDRIKIDRSFVALLGSKADGAAIVAAVVTLARSLGMATTAEGVETKTQQEFLAALGCSDLQGYSFAKPMPLHELQGYIASMSSKSVAASEGVAA